MDAEFFMKEIIDEVLAMYLAGASVYDICEYTKMSPVEVNQIIDRFSPYLG